MLKSGYLAGNSVYVCIDHSKEVIDTEMESKGPKEIFDWMSMVSN